jgi:cytochrome c-type biogenesis protein CcmH
MTSMAERTYGGAQKAAPGIGDEKSVSGTITIAPDLAGRIPAGATLFIMARERVQGGPPYAVHRIPVPAFPFQYSLSQADVLPMFGEGLQFADIDEMYLVVRVDQDGRVGQPDPGDMEGATKRTVKPGQKGVDIVIDKVY